MIAIKGSGLFFDRGPLQAVAQQLTRLGAVTQLSEDTSFSAGATTKRISVLGPLFLELFTELGDLAAERVDCLGVDRGLI